jgi:hypothetical protein
MKSSAESDRTPVVLAVSVAVPVLLRLLALVLDDGRIWGFDMLRYMDLPTALLFSLLPFAAFLLYRSGVRTQWEAMTEWTAAPAAFAAGILAVTLLFPMRTFFYGDGGLLIPQVFRFASGDTVDMHLLMNLKSSPLAGVLLAVATEQAPRALTALGMSEPGTAFYPFTVLSLLSFAAAAAYTLYTWRGRAALLRLLILCGGAGWLLYFGYVEYYAPFYSAVYVFLLAGERLLKGRGGLFGVLLAYGIAVATHYQALALLPALATLLWLARRRRTGRPLRISTLWTVAAAVVVTAVVVYLAGGWYDSDSRIVMPIVAQHSPAGTQSYTLLSTWHLVDVVNLLLLLSPAALVLLPGTGLVRIPGMRAGRESVFHFSALLGYGLFCFFANTSLGLARDWDICAPLGVMLLLAAVSMFDREDARNGTHIAVLAVSSFLLTLPWIAVNVDRDTAAGRFADVLELDAGHMYADYALSGYEALRKHYASIGDAERILALTKKKLQVVDYPGHYIEYMSIALADSGAALREERMRWLLRTLTARMASLSSLPDRRAYSMTFAQADSLADALCFHAMLAGLGKTLRPQMDSLLAASGEPRYWISTRALMAYEDGRYDEASALLRMLLDRGFRHPAVFRLLGASLAIQRRFSDALTAYEQGLSVFPDDALIAFLLGKYYTQAGINLKRAKQLLQSCAARGLPADRQDEIRALLQRLR